MIRLRNLLSVGLVVALGSKALMLPLTVTSKSIDQLEQQEVKELQIEIGAFLNLWLVDHNIEKALRFFSVQSASNKMMLSADCAGYIKDENRKSQKAVQAGTEKFLRDFASGDNGRSLANQLNVSRIMPVNSSNTLNNVQQDKYLLVKLGSRDSKKIIKEKQVIDQLRGSLKGKHVYMSFIQVGDGVLYFVWIQEVNRWQIYHADMVCI